ncbi:MAG: hypothetical protein KG075_16735 [Alphaproteobacteria bacterium]|nr:hypothetical protein [Alphaproteobacteria bacterium]
MKERVYWTERLGVASVLAILALQARHRRRARVAHYDQAPPSGWARALLRLAAIDDIRVAAVALGDLVNDQGVNLYWHNDSLMLAASREALTGLPTSQLSAEFDIPAVTLSAFLDRAAFADLHRSSLRSTALWGNARLDNDRKHILLLKKSIFAEGMAAQYRQANIGIAFIPAPDALLWFARELLATCNQWLVGQRNAAPEASPAPRLLLQYVAGFDRSRVSDIPWLDGSGLRRDQILVYAVPPEDGEPAAEARENGFGFTPIVHARPPFSSPAYLSSLMAAIRNGLRLPCRGDISGAMRRIWLAGWLLHFLRARASWEIIFRAHGVKIHMHVGDASAQSLAITDALRRAGGIDIALQLGGSCIELDFEHRSLAGRVLFCWGNLFRRMYETRNRLLPGKFPLRLIVGGHQHDHLIAQHRNKAEAFKDSLHARGLRQVIVAFDNVARRDFLITPRQLVEFHSALLEIAAADPTVAMVVKSKPGATVSLQADDQALRMRLIAEGRWIELPKATSIFEAALQGDVVVALHINTAAMEAAIAGVPHIYYDTTAWKAHPFYAQAGQLIATNRSRLRELLTWHATHEASFWSPVELQTYRDDLSPYRDSASGHRLGKLIGRCFAALAAGASPDEAIKLLEDLDFLKVKATPRPA